MNPEASYVIFEKRSGRKPEAVFREVMELLKAHHDDLIATEFYRDENSRTSFMVVQIRHEQADQIARLIFDSPLPEDLVIYFYGSPKEGLGKDNQGTPKTRRRKA